VIYGKADVIVPQEKVLTILFNEVLNPFFVYQLFCITLWFNDHSKYYAAILLIYNIVTVFLSAYDTLSTNRQFRKAENHSCNMQLLRPNGSYVTIKSSELVPGDIVLVP
jgi:magnesium-transporting ATPase (P-type)